MTKSGSAGWRISLLTLYVLTCATGIILAYEFGPPTGMTGDFGDQNCTQCHLGSPLNVTGGSLTITGVPAQYSPGATYPITITLSRGGQRRWGFELAVRTVGNHLQAGTLAITDVADTQIQSAGGIQFIEQTTQGSLSGSQQGSWSFNWIAPSQPVGDVHFSCAANAANNDDSNFGDFIYTTFLSSSPAPPSPAADITYFAQAAVGGGYSTEIKLMNTGSATATGNLILTGQEGNPLEVSFTQAGSQAAAGSTLVISVPAGGTQFITAGSQAPQATTGWARVESSGGSISGVSTFQLAPGGILQTVAGVLGTQPVTSATIPIDNDDSQRRYTGFAVANAGNDPINIRIVTLNTDGVPRETFNPPELNPLSPHSQRAKFLHEFSSSYLTFRGSMVLVEQVGRTFSAVALVQVQGTSGVLFTAIPVIPQKAPNVP